LDDFGLDLAPKHLIVEDRYKWCKSWKLAAYDHEEMKVIETHER
jgi:hypothetical protein